MTNIQIIRITNRQKKTKQNMSLVFIFEIFLIKVETQKKKKKRERRDDVIIIFIC